MLGHTGFYIVIGNPAVMASDIVYWYTNVVNNWLFTLVINATFSVDSFFVLSGCLLTYGLLNALRTRQKLLEPKFWGIYVLRRYWRLTPALALMMLFTVGIWKVLGNNTVPQWQPALDETDGCSYSWWVNILYLNNLIHTQTGNDLCLGWSWYLANDFQFFLIAPLLILPMIKWPKFGIAPTVGLISISTASCFGISYANNLPPGGSTSLLNPRVNEHYNTAYDKMFVQLYVRPYSRFTTYGIGILVGYLMHIKPRGSVRVPWYCTLIGWLLAIGIMCAVIFGVEGVTNNRWPTQIASAFYNALSRPAWGIALGYVILACYHGYGGIINDLLSMDLWTPLARMTYMVYLIHPLVIQYLYTTRQITFFADATTYATLFIPNIMLAYMFAFVAVLAFETPIIVIEKIALNI